MHILKWAIFLFAFWLLLSGFFQPLLISFGLISVALVLWVLKRMDKVDGEVESLSIDFKMLRYIPWLVSQIAQSSLHVTKLIWGGSKNITPVLTNVPIKSLHEEHHVLYANSITLTPGTLSVDLDDKQVTVHALRSSSVESLNRGEMEEKINSIWGDKK